MGLIIIAGGRHDGDIHASNLFRLDHIYLGENLLICHAHGVIPIAIERRRRQTSKIAHPGKNNAHQTIKELIHTIPTDRHHDANRHALAEFEGRNSFAGAADDGL